MPPHICTRQLALPFVWQRELAEAQPLQPLQDAESGHAPYHGYCDKCVRGTPTPMQ